MGSPSTTTPRWQTKPAFKIVTRSCRSRLPCSRRRRWRVRSVADSSLPVVCPVISGPSVDGCHIVAGSALIDRTASRQERALMIAADGSGEPVDLLGVGIGPFNLSLAAIADGVPGLRAIFLEQQPEFRWHPGLMIEGTTLQ